MNQEPATAVGDTLATLRLGTRYYPAVAQRRLGHYLTRRRHGYTDRGSLERAATTILAARARHGFRAGSHFPGIWPRDLCFAANGLVAAGYGEELGQVGADILGRIDDTFYTDFHPTVSVATPAEGVDTFPAIVLLLDAADRLQEHAPPLARLARLHRRKFFADDQYLVTGAGSSWWDSAAKPRETYNTVMLLAATRRLRAKGVKTTYTSMDTAIDEALDRELWNGTCFDEHRGSDVIACDANVVPLYLGIVDEWRADRIVSALDSLRTRNGLRMREQVFSPREVRPFFLFHRDYHCHLWPWNSYMYAIGLERYGYSHAAAREVACIERRLREIGNFVEVLTADGRPYIKRGYAAAEDFTVAAALWTEYHRTAGTA